jgi:chemotaxis protein methyltransferase CheR
VRKRINRRLEELGLGGIADYRTHLETHSDEWHILDSLTPISISRFYRDRGVFDYLGNDVLPDLARTAQKSQECRVRCWCIGCASGEEPYTLAILWAQHVQREFPGIRLGVLATDRDPQMLTRARRATYPSSSVKDVPAEWLSAAFTESDEHYTLRPEFRRMVDFRQQDIRKEIPDEKFHLVLCRNLVFTYFAEDVQYTTLRQIVERLLPGGFLVVGKNETIPEGSERLGPHDAKLGIYRVG